MVWVRNSQPPSAIAWPKRSHFGTVEQRPGELATVHGWSGCTGGEGYVANLRYPVRQDSRQESPNRRKSDSLWWWWSTFLYIFLALTIYMYICVYMNICICVYMYICKLCIYISPYIYIYIHIIYTYIHTLHTYIHIYIYNCIHIWHTSGVMWCFGSAMERGTAGAIQTLRRVAAQSEERVTVVFRPRYPLVI